MGIDISDAITASVVGTTTAMATGATVYISAIAGTSATAGSEARP
jgi:hypothetical protein